jgi:hypothetical protein
MLKILPPSTAVAESLAIGLVTSAAGGRLPPADT